MQTDSAGLVQQLGIVLLSKHAIFKYAAYILILAQTAMIQILVFQGSLILRLDDRKYVVPFICGVQKLWVGKRSITKKK